MKTNKKIHFEISERKILLRIIDVLVVLLSLHIVDISFHFNYFNISDTNFYWTLVLAIYINLIGTVFEMYNLQIASNQFKIIKSIFLATFFIGVFYLLTPILTPALPSNRIQILYFFGAILVSLLFWRLFYQSFIASYRFEKKVILVCDKENLEVMVVDLQNADPHYKIIGYVNTDISTDDSQSFSTLQNIKIQDLNNFLKKNKVSELVIASQNTENFTRELYNQLLNLLENGLIIKEYIQVFEDMTQRIPIHHFNKDFYKYFPFSKNNQNQLYKLGIRVLEILISVLGLSILIIILPFILIGNLFGNQGKLFYVQTRIGRNGLPFEIFKFRTMVSNAEVDGAVFSMQNDIRINPFGKFLRKTRIDEIPQFFNIIKGEMAFIGPRPERPFFVEQLSKVMPFYDTRHVIKPGITGWAQVKYTYGSSLDDSLIKLQYDLYYIKHQSFFLDLNIIIKTVSTVLFYRGQ